MTPGEDDRFPKFPENWDVLATAEEEAGSFQQQEAAEPTPAPPERRGPLPIINLVASFWAEGVTVLAMITATLLGLNAAGHRLALAAVPWAAVLGFVWWLFAASVLVTIRQGTPGMLLAGIQFDERIVPGRVVAVIAVAAFGAVLFGLPGLLGSDRSPLARAGGRPLEAVPME